MQDDLDVNPRLLRLKQIIGDERADPPIIPIIPISKSAWWKGVAEGKYPKPLKLSENVTVWRSDEIQTLVNNICQNGTQGAG
jgi:prophage regulatory protein